MTLNVKSSGKAFLFLLCSFLIAPFLFSLLTLGVGHALNAVVGMGLVPCTAVFLATVFTTVCAVGFAFIASELDTSNKLHLLGVVDDDDNNEQWDEDEEDEDMSWGHRDSEPKSTPRPTPAVGRNQPCPCGSKKKYKACCLNREAASQEDISF